MRIGGRHLKKVALELGGKNPLIVMEDADLAAGASNAAWSAFLHQGRSAIICRGQSGDGAGCAGAGA